MVFWKESELVKVAMVAKMQSRWERTHGRRAAARKEAKAREKWKGRKQNMLDLW